MLVKIISNLQNNQRKERNPQNQLPETKNNKTLISCNKMYNNINLNNITIIVTLMTKLIQVENNEHTSTKSNDI